MNTTSKAYELGLVDGAASYAESGTAAAPVDGWDSDLINAVGFKKVCELFGLDDNAEKAGWTEQGLAALAEYSHGCEIGAARAAIDKLFDESFPNG